MKIRTLGIALSAIFVVTCWENPGNADSAIALLSGFDESRIDKVYPPVDEDSTGELAKLIYRLRKVDENALRRHLQDTDQFVLGDAFGVDGEIRAIESLQVPARLVEFLEISQLQKVVVATEDSEVTVMTTPLPSEAVVGDRVVGTGVVIESKKISSDGVDASLDESLARVVPAVIACAPLRWFPKSSEQVGWQLLSEAGLDVSLLAEAGPRNRKPLVPEDGDAFYSLLAAAAKVQKRESIPAPPYVEPVTMLQAEENLAGQWMRLDLETVQVTRISVTEPHRQTQLGADHYYQIDAVADLGNVVIKIERPPGQTGPPAIFKNRYPVSVVARDLPEFLKKRIRVQEGGDAVVAQFKNMISADVFFYRLWSYSTDFMEQFGGGDQFGPLLVAAQIRDREPTSEDPAGVSVIGWIAAAAVILAILAIWFWNRRVTARDLQVRERRKARESEQIELP